MVKFTENNMKTLEKRYLLKDVNGKTIETPDQMFDRVINTVCGDSNNELKSNILEMMHDLRFLPNTPTLMNTGTTNMLSACFVINIDDTLKSIVHDAGWQQALIHKMGGGVGMNFSKLRPKGDLISTTGGVTTGVLGFLPIFNELSESIRQGGKRDGANMGILNISHPEIEDWIKAKVGNNRFRNFNLSVLIDDKFMRAVESDSEWALHFNGKIYKTVKAKYLFNLICDSSYKCGCPGVIFVDEINRNNPLKDLMWIDTTNPCVTGDTEVLTPNGVSRADSLNVGDMIKVTHDQIFPIKKIEINGDMTVFEIQFDNNPSIKVTKSHQFLVNKPDCVYADGTMINIGFLPLENIKVGDKIRKFDYKFATVTSITKCQNETVYDIFEPRTDTWITNNLISRGCGEIPAFVGYYNGELIAESCNLGSQNLSKYCIPDEKHHGCYMFEMTQFVLDIHNAVEFLDLVIDANNYPFDFIDKGTKLTRKIGLGVTGLSECLIKLRMEYGSEKSIKFIENVFETLQIESHKASENIGRKKGYFPLSNLVTDEYSTRRNLCTTCIAPTGTIGRFMLGHPYSSGIEPPPAICMSSNIIDSKIEDGIHPLLIDMLKQSTQKGDEQWLENVIKKIKNNGKSIQHLTEIPVNIRKLFKVAEEISIEEHIKVQSTVQKYIDNAVSKTINMNNSATIDDVKKAYLLAYKTHCKGVTIYRDNCKDHQVFEASNMQSISAKNSIWEPNLEPIEDLTPRPLILGALSFTKRTSCNTLFINPTYHGDMVKSALEAFVDTNGGCVAMRNGISITVSVYQRILETINPNISRKALDIVMTHLESIKCQVCLKQMEAEKHKSNIKHPVDSVSCPSALASAMRFMLNHKVETFIDGKPLTEYISIHKNKNINEKPILIMSEIDKGVVKAVLDINKRKCPDCGNINLLKQEGCMNESCLNCGWGGCS